MVTRRSFFGISLGGALAAPEVVKTAAAEATSTGTMGQVAKSVGMSVMPNEIFKQNAMSRSIRSFLDLKDEDTGEDRHLSPVNLDIRWKAIKSLSPVSRNHFQRRDERKAYIKYRRNELRSQLKSFLGVPDVNIDDIKFLKTLLVPDDGHY